MNDDLISREEVLNLIDTAFESGAFDGRYAYENLMDAVQNLIHPLETDLVSRQAVIDTTETDCSWDIFNEWGNRTPIGESIIEAIKRVPSAEPERKTGKWEYVQYDGNPKIGNWHCSNCRLIVNLGFEGAPYYHYCPGCGAKMEVDG